MARFIAVPLLILAFACSSADPPSPFAPEIRMQQRGEIFFGSGTVAPVSISLEVRNRAQEPIKLRQVRLEAGVMTQYSVYPVTKIVKDTLAPGASIVVDIGMTAYTNVSRRRILEPLSLRATIDYEMGGKVLREIKHNARVAQ